MDGAARAYLAAVRRALAFDPPLAARITAEIEDHVAEALAARPMPIEKVLAGFGSPEDFARAVAAAQAPQRLWSSARLMLTALLLITLTMRLRVAALPEITADGWLWLARLGDRYGLIAALLGALLTALAARRLARGQAWPYWANPLRLTQATAAALLVSCLGGMVLTAIGLSLSPSWQASAPLLTTGAEVIALGLLLLDLRRLRQYPGLGGGRVSQT